MRDIFEQIAEMIKDKKTTQVEVAKKLNVNQGNISAIIRGKTKPSNPLKRLAEIIYGEERPPHPEPIIEKTILIMEEMNENTKESALECVQKEKWLEEMKKDKNESMERKAA